MHGWIPITAQVVAGLLLIAAIGWRNRRWRLVWLPWAALVGVALAVTAYWYIASQGLSDQTNPAPYALWIWIGLCGVATAVLIAGWRGARWWRRGVSALALPLCVLCSALTMNLWVGYFPTVQTAWNQLTAGPLPDQTDAVTVTAMQKLHSIPAKGTVVPVTIPDMGSGFKHRGELVYLPPAWYATDPPPPLPTVMMIGGEFNTPADWLRAGNAVSTADAFAAARGGNAPDGRKVKSTIHWVSAAHALDAEVRMYDKLFTKEDPNQVEEGQEFTANLNPNSLEVIAQAKLEPSLANAPIESRYQFERLGYFCVDPDSKPGRPVFNRTVALKDTWAKVEKKIEKNREHK